MRGWFVRIFVHVFNCMYICLYVFHILKFHISTYILCPGLTCQLSRWCPLMGRGQGSPCMWPSPYLTFKIWTPWGESRKLWGMQKAQLSPSPPQESQWWVVGGTIPLLPQVKKVTKPVSLEREGGEGFRENSVSAEHTWMKLSHLKIGEKASKPIWYLVSSQLIYCLGPNYQLHLIIFQKL